MIHVVAAVEVLDDPCDIFLDADIGVKVLNQYNQFRVPSSEFRVGGSSF